MPQALSVVMAAADGVLVRLRVQPRSRVARLDGVQGDRLRLRVPAPPVDGAANASCLDFLATTLGIRRAQIRLQAGATSRDKLVHITGLTPAQVAAALGLVLS